MWPETEKKQRWKQNGYGRVSIRREERMGLSIDGLYILYRLAILIYINIHSFIFIFNCLAVGLSVTQI